GVEPGDLVRPAVACGQDEHREIALFAAPAVEHGQPVDFGQPEIEDRRIIGFGRAQKMPVLAIGREIDGIARPLQRRLELRAQRGFVLDYQNPHSGAFPLRNRTGRPHVSTVYQVRTFIAKSRCGNRTALWYDQGLRPTIRPVRATTETPTTWLPSMNFSL